MILKNIIIRASPVHAGTRVRDMVLKCIVYGVHALPFCDAEGNITGRVTLKNIMRLACLPEHMIELAPVLGDQLSCLKDAEKKVREVMSDPIEPFVLAPSKPIHLGAPVMKALALMEQRDTSYLFVVDEKYEGIVTIHGIAKRMLDVDLNDSG